MGQPHPVPPGPHSTPGPTQHDERKAGEVETEAEAAGVSVGPLKDEDSEQGRQNHTDPHGDSLDLSRRPMLRARPGRMRAPGDDALVAAWRGPETAGSGSPRR
jgi:hypothetical protein